MHITICIPAFNNPEYTRRTLISVLEQTYRPLRVLLIDDHSPNSLEPLAKWFASVCDDGIQFTYIRNDSNLIADTFYVFYREVMTDWVLQLHHDDCLVLPEFIAQCVQLVEINPSLVACYGNAITERERSLMVNDLDPGWRILSGPDFIRYMLTNGHTAWSSILYRAESLKDFQFPCPPFLIDNQTHAQTGLDRDEGFSTFYLLAMRGDFAVSGQIVSERGQPSNSYSQSASWKTVGNSLFYIYFGVSLSQFHEKYADHVRKLAQYSTLLYGLPRREGFRLGALRAAYPESKTAPYAYVSTYLVTLFGLNRPILRALLLLQARDYRGSLSLFLTLPVYSFIHVTRGLVRQLKHSFMRFRGQAVPNR